MSNGAALMIASSIIVLSGAVCFAMSSLGPRLFSEDVTTVGGVLIAVGGLFFLGACVACASRKD
ncbi:MAG: hypothetical protein WD066_01005 [Planctomycetaceae bacterium]